MAYISYQEASAELVRNIESTERSLARAMSAYGGFQWNNPEEKEHLAKCVEAIAATLSMRAAFERMIASQIRSSE